MSLQCVKSMLLHFPLKNFKYRSAYTRAQYIRVIFSEVTRILNHLLNVPAYAADIGAVTPFLWCFEQREKLLEFHEAVSGARFHAAYFRPGGVHQDMPKGYGRKLYNHINTLAKILDDLEELTY